VVLNVYSCIVNISTNGANTNAKLQTCVKLQPVVDSWDKSRLFV